MNIDYLSADGHKWLLGSEGAGVFYCRRELLAQTRPALIGWMNVINHLDYANYDFTLKPDARKFECGTHNVPGLLALKASVELLMEVGIEPIAARLKSLTDRLATGLKTKGYELIGPRGGDEWSGIVSFKAKGINAEHVAGALRADRRIELAVRDGRLRASPHFYNTEEQIDRMVSALPRAGDSAR
jgi:selenocysteine lyase/cysteine desulfurase